MILTTQNCMGGGGVGLFQALNPNYSLHLFVPFPCLNPCKGITRGVDGS